MKTLDPKTKEVGLLDLNSTQVVAPQPEQTIDLALYIHRKIDVILKLLLALHHKGENGKLEPYELEKEYDRLQTEIVNKSLRTE